MSSIALFPSVAMRSREAPENRPRPSSRGRAEIAADVRWGIGIGSSVALVCAAIAIMIYFGRRFDSVRILIASLLGYAVMGILSGAVLGLLRPKLVSVLGRLVVTYVALVPVAFVGLRIVSPHHALGALTLRSLVMPVILAPVVLIGLAIVDRLIPDDHW